MRSYEFLVHTVFIPKDELIPVKNKIKPCFLWDLNIPEEIQKGQQQNT